MTTHGFAYTNNLGLMVASWAAAVHKKKCPPMDAYISKDQTEFKFVFAVAGYTEKDLAVEFDGRTLSVSGTKVNQEDADIWDKVHLGLSNRSFHIQLDTCRKMDLETAELANGLLCIRLKLHNSSESNQVKITVKS